MVNVIQKFYELTCSDKMLLETWDKKLKELSKNHNTLPSQINISPHKFHNNVLLPPHFR